MTEALVAAMQDAGVEPRERREAGLVLGRLGWRPDDLDAFVEVAPGPFLYGDQKETREIAQRYWIAKYPVTNLQFDGFVKDGKVAWSANHTSRIATETDDRCRQVPTRSATPGNARSLRGSRHGRMGDNTSAGGSK